jgi:hypothetical protein
MKELDLVLSRVDAVIVSDGMNTFPKSGRIISGASQALAKNSTPMLAQRYILCGLSRKKHSGILASSDNSTVLPSPI